MTFRVEWIDTALKELASMWLAANSRTRKRITKAAHEIDLQLAQDPLQVGESRPRGRRVLFEAPLGVTYRVDNGVVTVLHVWRFRERKLP